MLPPSRTVSFQPALPMRGVTVSSPLARLIDSLFQPALPMRGVTRPDPLRCRSGSFQPALPMRGVTAMVDTLAIALSFQPALPMRGVTDVNGTGAKPVYVFQPALPMRGVTGDRQLRPSTRHISTRTPHAGSDTASAPRYCKHSNFNPHSPCGE